MEQVFNPYLPLNEYIPDGEPHVFDGRVYIYGSHDVTGGTAYCQDHYTVWSAPVDNLKDWRCEGVSYRRTQDPSNAQDKLQLWAPDVTKGPDGRYYLYYCFSFYPEIGVAVSDSPAGPFEFYGHVKYPDHILGGKTLEEYMPFDPAVFTDDDGRVYLYYGFAPACEKEFIAPEFSQEELEKLPEDIRKEIENLSEKEWGENSMAVELEPDMITMKDVPHVCVPGGHHTEGTGFEGHGFFEASSLRKINGKYYFVYSSHKSHELCYAVSDKPAEGFVYGGTIVSNGDIGLNGRETPVYPLGNNHGGIVQVNDDFYIFYHRQTNGTEFSRQGCAEKIQILPDGSIPQVEITSCGLNGGPLFGSGSYPAAIACHLTHPKTSPVIDYNDPELSVLPRIVQHQNRTFITDIQDGTVVGYKYFDFENVTGISLEFRGTWKGALKLCLDENGTETVGQMSLDGQLPCWTNISIPVQAENGIHALYVKFEGEGKLDFKQLVFNTKIK